MRFSNSKENGCLYAKPQYQNYHPSTTTTPLSTMMNANVFVVFTFLPSLLTNYGQLLTLTTTAD